MARRRGRSRFLALGDYALQRYRLMKQLKMTKQEVRDEARESEGNAEVKGRIRRIQREMARRRMIDDVKKATVVITNPTHFAVALEYQPRQRWLAPMVLAKGRDLLAARIREEARKHERPDRREQAARAGALQDRRGRRGDSGAALRRGRRGARVPRAHQAADALIWPQPDARIPRHLLAPAAVLAVVLLMIVPLPPLLLDLLLSVDIGLAVVLLLTAIYVKPPVEFSVFPSLLLLLTLIRLSLNVASTRLVLLHGGDGVEAAGDVIRPSASSSSAATSSSASSSSWC